MLAGSIQAGGAGVVRTAAQAQSAMQKGRGAGRQQRHASMAQAGGRQAVACRVGIGRKREGKSSSTRAAPPQPIAPLDAPRAAAVFRMRAARVGKRLKNG